MNYLRLGDVCGKISSGVTPRGGYAPNAALGVALISERNVTSAGFSRDVAFIEQRQPRNMPMPMSSPGTCC